MSETRTSLHATDPIAGDIRLESGNAATAEIDPGLHAAVSHAARAGLSRRPLSLAPWLFYDDLGSELFEAITRLPEYYLTRTERALFEAHADALIRHAAAGRELSILELGAGTARKTGILLQALARQQGSGLYQPIDVSEAALAEAERSLARVAPEIRVEAHVANYTTDRLQLRRPHGCNLLALYIGSSIGNFEPNEARGVLRHLRSSLVPGDTLLLGTDLAPGSHKSVETLLAAYNDAAGVTAQFNLNVLARLNRDLGTDFQPQHFAHEARWNAAESRIEMHLVAQAAQVVHLPQDSTGPAVQLAIARGESIHTENSYKFSVGAVQDLLEASGFTQTRQLQDQAALFAVTLARAL